MVSFSNQAAGDIRRIEHWWRTQRPEAHGLFGEELKAVLARVEQLPSTGQLYRRGRPEIRRVLLPRTRNHLYYRSSSDGIYVVTIESAKSSRPPRL